MLNKVYYCLQDNENKFVAYDYNYGVPYGVIEFNEEVSHFKDVMQTKFFLEECGRDMKGVSNNLKLPLKIVKVTTKVIVEDTK